MGSKFLDFIAQHEGTDKGRGYNEVLGYGRFGDSPRPLTDMTLDEVYDFGRQILSHPDNNLNSSALGRYQITGRTLRDLQAAMNLPGDTLYSPAVQDRMAYTLAQRRGWDPSALQNEWTSLKKLSTGDIAMALDGEANRDGANLELRPMHRPEGLPEKFGLRQYAAGASDGEQWDGSGVFLPHKYQKLTGFGL